MKLVSHTFLHEFISSIVKKKKKKDQIKKERLFEKNKICSKFRVKNLKLKHESFDKVVFIYESLGNKTFSEIDKLL